VQVILSDYLRGRRGDSGVDANMPNWRWMRGQFGLVGAPGPSHPEPETPPPPPTGTPSTSWTSQLFAQLTAHAPGHGSSSEPAASVTPPAKE
jgi:hypothetical protein